MMSSFCQILYKRYLWNHLKPLEVIGSECCRLLSKTSTYKSKHEDKEIDIVPACMEDRNNILEFMKRTFYKEDPVMKSVNCPTNNYFDIYFMDCLNQGLSVKAVTNPGNAIVGVGLFALEKKNDPPVDEIILLRSGMHRKVVEFDVFAYNQSNIFRRGRVNTYLEIRYLSVSPEMQKMGLGTALTAKGIEKALEMNLPLVGIFCTSYYSYKLAKKLGFIQIWSIKYKDYVDSERIQIFFTKPPHTIFRVMILSIAHLRCSSS